MALPIPGRLGLAARFFGSTISGAASFAAGAAIGPVLSPPVEDLRQRTWARHAIRKPAVVELAQGVAEGQIDEAQARAWAKTHGFGDKAFTALVKIADSGPGVGRAFELWRRGEIDEAGFRRALKREALEDEWIDALVPLKRVLLSPAELANAVVQGFRNQDEAAADAALQGVDARDFGTMVATTGLPPGPETGLAWLRRNIIDEGAFGQLVREGHTKVKYIDEYLAAQWHVLTAAEYANLHLKGWISEAQMIAGGRLTGYDAEAMRLLYLNRGRPAAPTQMATAAVRGIDGPDGSPMDEAQFLKGIAQSNIRPEYGPMLWESRFLYPSLFQLTRLVDSGAIPIDTAETWARKARYAPEVVTALRQSWESTGDAPAAKWANRARTRLFTTARAEFMDGSITEARARELLTTVGATAGEQDAIIGIWEAENEVSRAELTVAQIRKFYREGVLTHADALDRLLDRGYTPDDAEKLLANK